MYVCMCVCVHAIKEGWKERQAKSRKRIRVVVRQCVRMHVWVCILLYFAINSQNDHGSIMFK